MMVLDYLFSKVNPNLEYFGKENQDHSIDNAVEFLVEIISSDKNIQEHIMKQLNEYILQDINFQQLHNNLIQRYKANQFIRIIENEELIEEFDMNLFLG